jgi:hypothetical protein
MKIFEIVYQRGDIFYVQADSHKKAIQILCEDYPDYQGADLDYVKEVKSVFRLKRVVKI